MQYSFYFRVAAPGIVLKIMIITSLFILNGLINLFHPLLPLSDHVGMHEQAYDYISMANWCFSWSVWLHRGKRKGLLSLFILPLTKKSSIWIYQFKYSRYAWFIWKDQGGFIFLIYKWPDLHFELQSSFLRAVSACSLSWFTHNCLPSPLLKWSICKCQLLASLKVPL